MDDVHRAMATSDTGDDHPAGDISLPARIRSEVKLLALAGMSSAVVGVVTAGCWSSWSFSHEALPL